MSSPLSALKAETLPVGAQLGRYRIGAMLGRGGMGAVYRADDSRLPRVVALKVLPQDLADNSAAKARFLREARLAAQLRHPNIVTVLDADQHDGRLFIAMELIDGGSADARVLQHGPLPWTQATTIIAQVAEGLATAHANGLVHRDIKPGNILLCASGAAKLSDFGLVKQLDQESGMLETMATTSLAVMKSRSHQALTAAGALTGTGMVVGTLEYMSPEQCAGAEVDGRCDLYSLGLTYCTLLTGRPPFEANSPVHAIYQHLYVPPPDPRRVVEGLPAGCTAIVAKAAAKSADDRFRDASEMARALRNLLRRPQQIPEECRPNPKPTDPDAALSALAEAASRFSTSKPTDPPSGRRTLPPNRVSVSAKPTSPQGSGAGMARTSLAQRRSSRSAGWIATAVGIGGTLCLGVGLGLWLANRPDPTVPVEKPTRAMGKATDAPEPSERDDRPMMVDMKPPIKVDPQPPTKVEPPSKTNPAPPTELPAQTQIRTLLARWRTVQTNSDVEQRSRVWMDIRSLAEQLRTPGVLGEAEAVRTALVAELDAELRRGAIYFPESAAVLRPGLAANGLPSDITAICPSDDGRTVVLLAGGKLLIRELSADANIASSHVVTCDLEPTTLALRSDRTILAANNSTVQLLSWPGSWTGNWTRARVAAWEDVLPRLFRAPGLDVLAVQLASDGAGVALTAIRLKNADPENAPKQYWIGNQPFLADPHRSWSELEPASHVQVGAKSIATLATNGRVVVGSRASTGASPAVFYVGTGQTSEQRIANSWRIDTTTTNASPVALSPTGHLLAYQNRTSLCVWHCPSMRAAAELSLPSSDAAITALGFSADGRCLAMADSRGRVRTWLLVKTVWADDFESYPAAQWPPPPNGTWTEWKEQLQNDRMPAEPVAGYWFPDAAALSFDNSKQNWGPKNCVSAAHPFGGRLGLRLCGSTTSQLRALAHRALQAQPPLLVEARVYLGDDATGTGHSREATIGLRNGYHWRSAASQLWLRSGVPFPARTWGKVLVSYDQIGSAVVKTVWLNDELAERSYSPAPGAEKELNLLQLGSASASVWFDDVRVAVPTPRPDADRRARAELDSVLAELERANPGYEPKPELFIRDGRVLGLLISFDKLQTIAPLTQLTSLELLILRADKRPLLLRDMASLNQLPLVWLEVINATETDFTPLRGHKTLKFLNGRPFNPVVPQP